MSGLEHSKKDLIPLNEKMIGPCFLNILDEMNKLAEALIKYSSFMQIVGAGSSMSTHILRTTSECSRPELISKHICEAMGIMEMIRTSTYYALRLDNYKIKVERMKDELEKDIANIKPIDSEIEELIKRVATLEVHKEKFT